MLRSNDRCLSNPTEVRLRADMPQGQTAGSPWRQRRLLTVAEVTTVTGLSRATVYRLISRGILPVVRIIGTRTVRIAVEDLETLIQSNKFGA